MKFSTSTVLLLVLIAVALGSVATYLFSTGRVSLKVKKELTAEEVMQEEMPENMLLAQGAELDRITTGRGDFSELRVNLN